MGFEPPTFHFVDHSRQFRQMHSGKAPVHFFPTQNVPNQKRLHVSMVTRSNGRFVCIYILSDSICWSQNLLSFHVFIKDRTRLLCVSNDFGIQGFAEIVFCTWKINYPINKCKWYSYSNFIGNIMGLLD